MPPSSKIPLTLIVAATPKNGIGKNGALPWPMLKKEMAYFARVTKRVPASSSSSSQQNGNAATAAKNAVIMGRKTWDSIPPKLRPLKERVNIVLSSQSREAFPEYQDLFVAKDIESGVAAVLRRQQEQSSSSDASALGRVFVIGGAGVYEQALRLEQCRSVLLTRVREEFECDTFFPDLEAGGEGWERKSRGKLEEFVGEEVPEGGLEESGVGFEFQLWQR